MADITLTGSDGAERACAKGDLWFPYIGNWTALLTLTDADDPPEGIVQLSFHGLSLRGFVVRADQAEALNTVVVAGGAGGLWKKIPAKMYDNGLSVSLIANEIMSDAGESLDPLSTADVLAQPVQQYPRLSDEPQNLLNTLCDTLSAPGTQIVWRVLTEGTVFIGTDTWADVAPAYSDGSDGKDPQYQLLETDPAHRYYQVIAPVSIAVLPGATFLLGKVGAVRYIDDGSSFVGRIYYCNSDDDGRYEDPLSAGVRSIVREELRSTTFHRCFTGQVVTQWGNGGRLDILMDDERLPPLTNVPYRVPYPGCSMIIVAGARVQVDFEDGDPRRPAARLYEPGDGAKEVVLTGDTVKSGTLRIVATGAVPPLMPVGTLTVSYTDEFGHAYAPLVLSIPGLAVTSGSPFEVPIKGKATGSALLRFP